MVEELELVTAFDPPPSPARTRAPERTALRAGLVQHRWHPDPARHCAAVGHAVHVAASQGAAIVCLPELTLSRYFAVDPTGPARGGIEPEPLPGGPTHAFAAELAARTGVVVQASLYERADDGGLGYNTAICVAPDGSVLARARKLHLPVTAGYHEDRYFRPGDARYPVAGVAGGAVGFPTCWDQWFPEVARVYALAGADVLVYPSAIGSEPDHPDFDTAPLWEQVIRAQGIMNGLFMVVPNRVGTEGPVTFYGSSFVSDPYGRVLVKAPRDRPAVLVADLDLDQRRDWLELFPLLRTRRVDAYASLLEDANG